MVYTPPGYSTSQKYGVIYAYQGIGTDPGTIFDGWCVDAGIVADNLIGQGIIKPVIIVALDDQFGNGDVKDMTINDAIPYIDSNYSTYADADHRGVYGYSWGGAYAFDVGCENLNSFHYVSPSSACIYIIDPVSSLFPNGYDSRLKCLFISCGDADWDGFYPTNQAIAQYVANYPCSYWLDVPGGGHDAGVWRPAMWNFLQLADNLGISKNPNPPATTNGWYCIKNRTSGLVIDDSGGSTSAGTTMGQWAKVVSANLNWQLVSSDSGYYYIQNQTSGLYLDGFGYTTNGSAVKQWGMSGSYNQQWQPVASDSGYYYIKNRATSLYLDGGAATANGAAMKQWGYANSPNLQWSLQPVDGTYKLISQNSGLAMETFGQHDANGAQINQWSYYGGGNQQWKLTDTGNGIYKIIGVESGRSLDINGSGTTNGTVVQIYDYAANKTSQQFKLTSSVVGQFQIAPNYTTSSCLDVYGASTANGAIVYLWQRPMRPTRNGPFKRLDQWQFTRCGSEKSLPHFSI